jgi:hypothetical protein
MTLLYKSGIILLLCSSDPAVTGSNSPEVTLGKGINRHLVNAFKNRRWRISGGKIPLAGIKG